MGLWAAARDLPNVLVDHGMDVIEIHDLVHIKPNMDMPFAVCLFVDMGPFGRMQYAC